MFLPTEVKVPSFEKKTQLDITLNIYAHQILYYQSWSEQIPLEK